MGDSVSRFLYQALVHLARAFLFSLSLYLFPLFSSVSSYFFRLRTSGGCKQNNAIHSEVTSEDIVSLKESSDIGLEPEAATEQDVTECTSTTPDSDNEQRTQEFSFSFKFPTFEEFSKSKKDNVEFFNPELAPSTSSRKYEFMSEKSLKGFIDEAEAVSFPVKEYDVDTKSGRHLGNEDISTIHDFLSDKDLEPRDTDAGDAAHEGPVEQPTSSLIINRESKLSEPVNLTEEEDKDEDAEGCDEAEFQSDKDSLFIGSDSESTTFENVRSVMRELINSYSDGFLSDEDFGGEFEMDDATDMNNEKVGRHGDVPVPEEGHETQDFDDGDSDVMEELRKLEEDNLQNSTGTSKTEFLSEKDFCKTGERDCDYQEDDEPTNGSADFNKPKSKSSSDLDSGDANKLESLWEHQELIEQLRMELRKVKATGLPTILEESESPKIMEDLKPWKIEERFQLQDCMGELHKFYKSYRDRMRKFDILNYQKMYAIGFLQLKDPLQSVSSEKVSGPSTLKSVLSQNLWQMRSKSQESEPMIQFMKEVQSELEVVYVGQMCLSWEILQWQYEKALNLWDSDPRGVRRYNEVAGEFQQFQVLIQRFIEDEPFQGPRIQNYIKSRCVLRNLLQVPLIREDSKKDRKKGRKGERGEYTITSDMLVEILEESIRIFWRFLRADKNCSSSIVKGQRGTHAKLQNPGGDLSLFMEARKTLHKKERKLKDLLRSGNCILRRFRKCQEDDDSDQVLYFFSQVDMKLVSRVLNMTSITREQLVWCHSKLSKITFAKRKIQVEPSFLLFPC